MRNVHSQLLPPVKCWEGSSQPRLPEVTPIEPRGIVWQSDCPPFCAVTSSRVSFSAQRISERCFSTNSSCSSFC